MIYLDNAATSWPKPCRVYEEMSECIRRYCANPGRGGHGLSLKCGREIFSCRKVLAEFFNISNPLRICFTKNTTESLNFAIKGILKEGDHVVTTSMEHNSVLRPLKACEKDGITTEIVYADSTGRIDPGRIENSIRKNTRMVVCTFSSNVNGIKLPIREIGEICSRKKIIFLLDAAQGSGSEYVDVEETKADMLAFPGHKGLLGPQGTGGLYVREGIQLMPMIKGGTGSSSKSLEQPLTMPDSLESGTLNTPGIIGLKHGVEFIESIGIKRIREYKNSLLKELHKGLSSIDGVRLYSSCENNSGIAALNIDGLDSVFVSRTLDKEFNTATRAGLHCAPLAHKTFGTLETGLVRLSLGCFNTASEIELAIDALKNIAKGRFNHQ